MQFNLQPTLQRRLVEVRPLRTASVYRPTCGASCAQQIRLNPPFLGSELFVQT